MYNEHLRDQDITAYVLAKHNNEYIDLSKEKFVEFQNHYSSCDICKLKVDEAEKLFLSMSSNKKKNFQLLFSAASIILAGFLTILYMNINSSDSDGYGLNPDFEVFIENQLKSEMLKVHRPLKNEILQIPYKFSWLYNEPLKLSIYNNKSDLLLETTFQKNHFPLKEKLPNGLYYWKLETSDELLFLSKFKIGNP